MPLAGLRARAANVGQILETLCALGKARRGPLSAKATAGQTSAVGRFCLDVLIINLWR